jgi:hypothetical protein
MVPKRETAQGRLKITVLQNNAIGTKKPREWRSG